MAVCFASVKAACRYHGNPVCTGRIDKHFFLALEHNLT
jgi:hypothetical protein